jgi:hypothetical protein
MVGVAEWAEKLLPGPPFCHHDAHDQPGLLLKRVRGSAPSRDLFKNSLMVITSQPGVDADALAGG